eukprot:7694300-Pyramimonas_sp.AAC.1
MTGGINLEAAKSFPLRIASTWDGLHPRHFALITEQLADLVAKQLLIIERLGFMPAQIQAIISVLAVKHKHQDPQATEPAK